MRRLATLLIAASLASPALAAVTVGATIKDTKGGVVGTVASVSGGNVVVDTGAHKVAVPEASFGTTPEGPLLAITKADLDAAAEQAMAAQKQQLAAAIQPGATVRGLNTSVLGTIEKVDGEFLMLKAEAGKARIPASGLVLKEDGLHFGMTAAQFADAVKASTEAETAETSAAAPAETASN